MLNKRWNLAYSSTNLQFKASTYKNRKESLIATQGLVSDSLTSVLLRMRWRMQGKAAATTLSQTTHLAMDVTPAWKIKLYKMIPQNNQRQTSCLKEHLSALNVAPLSSWEIAISLRRKARQPSSACKAPSQHPKIKRRRLVKRSL